MSAPPLLRVNYKFYPLGKKRSKCRHIPPLRKRQMFSRDQRYRHSYPLRNDFKNPLPPLRISLTLNRGGADIKWNGPLYMWSILYVFCVFQYGRLAKFSNRLIAGPSFSRPNLFCFDLVWPNHVAGKYISRNGYVPDCSQQKVRLCSRPVKIF